MLDEALAEGLKSANYVGGHETTHLVDSATGFRLSGGKFAERQSQIAKDIPEYFSFLDEKNFIPGVPFGGHSHANEKERLASLFSTLKFAEENWDEWKTKLQSAPANIQNAYKARSSRTQKQYTRDRSLLRQRYKDHKPFVFENFCLPQFFRWRRYSS